MIAKQVYYSGRVQGVGFRFTVHEIAKRYAVVGWVQNLPDGRVHLVVKGNSNEVDLFLTQVREESRLTDFIKDNEESEVPTTLLANTNDFSIRR